MEALYVNKILFPTRKIKKVVNKYYKKMTNEMQFQLKEKLCLCLCLRKLRKIWRKLIVPHDNE